MMERQQLQMLRQPPIEGGGRIDSDYELRDITAPGPSTTTHTRASPSS